MRKIGFIVIATIGIFLIEFFLFDLGGRFLKPNLLILLIVYINLTFGVRYSLLTALFAGLIKDSFSVNVFGLETFTFVLSAFMSSILRKYLFHTSLYSLRIILAFCISFIYSMIFCVLYSMFIQMDFKEFIVFVLFPEVFLTTLVADFTFRKLRKCALKFSV